MKDKVMDALQRFSKAMFIPVLILPIAGILIAVGNLFTNVRLQAVLPFLNNPVTIGFGTLLSGSLNAMMEIEHFRFIVIPQQTCCSRRRGFIQSGFRMPTRCIFAVYPWGIRR